MDYKIAKREVGKMAVNRYNYLTEDEKRLIGCVEYIPSEYSEEDIYTNDDAHEIDFLDDIFNVKF